jgi:hypothetical protein
MGGDGEKEKEKKKKGTKNLNSYSSCSVLTFYNRDSLPPALAASGVALSINKKNSKSMRAWC